MRSKSPQQERNVAGRDIAARDIIHQNRYNLDPPSTIRELAAKLQLTEDEAEGQSTFISQLEHYTRPPSIELTRDLAQKLKDSARTDVLQDGLEWKEQFYKKLVKLQFSIQAQELFVHMLSKIHTYFILNIRPRILDGASRTEIDSFVYTLVEELYEDVGNSELNVTMTEIHGMVYFLAGNCYIDWG